MKDHCKDIDIEFTDEQAELMVDLTADMLDHYSSMLSGKVCNDWEFPETWAEQDKHDFVRQYHDWNGDPEEFDPDRLILPDFAVAGFLSFLARERD